MKNLKFLFVGIVFGIVLVKSEVVSWFRIQEMFRFQAIHMYGIITLAIVVGAISILLIRKFNIKAADGSEINLKLKALSTQKCHLWWCDLWIGLGLDGRLSRSALFAYWCRKHHGHCPLIERGSGRFCLWIGERQIASLSAYFCLKNTYTGTP